MVVWGVPIVGITETKFLWFLFIVTLYYAINFVFVVVRVNVLCNSVAAFYEMFLREHNWGWHDRGKREVYEDELKLEEQERTFLLIRYPRVGFLEYFVAPIIFPATLYILTFAMLLIRMARF